MEISKRNDYQIRDKAKSGYNYSKVVQQTGGTGSISISAGGGDESVFEIPIKCFNPGESWLRFDPTITAQGSSNVAWLPVNGVPFFRTIQAYTRNGVYLCDINNFEYYVRPAWMSQEHKDYLNSVGTSVDRDGTLISTVSEFFPSSGSDAYIYYTAIVDTTTSSTNEPVQFTELNYEIIKTWDNTYQLVNPGVDPVYCMRSAANTALTPKIRMPLSLIYNSFLSMKKDFYLNEVLILRFVWAGTGLLWYSTSVTDRTASAAALANGGLTVNNLYLYLARQTNQEIVESIKSQVMTSGMNILIPYVTSQKFTGSSAASALDVQTLRLNRAHGRKCRRILTTFVDENTANEGYMNRNTAGARIANFYSNLQNNRIQEFDIDCTAYDDYVLLKNQLKDKCTIGYEHYAYNWFWIDDFSDHSEEVLSDGSISCGISLDEEQRYDLNVTKAAVARSYVYYSYAICEKILSVGPSGVLVS